MCGRKKKPGERAQQKLKHKSIFYDVRVQMKRLFKQQLICIRMHFAIHNLHSQN